MNPACALLGVCALALLPVATGCQSTQATSAEREAEGSQLLNSEKRLKVKKENPDIKVLDTAMLTDDSGTAVIVEVENTSDEVQANVPVLIDVRDAKGKTVFSNDTPGLEPALVAIPVIESGETFDWINNQVLPTGKPASVKVKVGFGDEDVPQTIPEIKVGKPKLKTDPVTGVEAVGTVTNDSPVLQEFLTIFAVARKGDEIVAAGRAVLKRLQPNGERDGTYHVFFVGDPEGADITATAPPSVLEKEIG
ncbi:MAG: hypothetical protein KDB58_08515 [Solirubrobacterales bacterium]|nr:hypothetical protein [Solirubrobacterales bacterium]MCB8971351.1 hypothetical protein [Thermoleophilales bacterium]MCO5325792.1 hypothetical protein [Solirubrobacterales bacterium]